MAVRVRGVWEHAPAMLLLWGGGQGAPSAEEVGRGLTSLFL